MVTAISPEVDATELCPEQPPMDECGVTGVVTDSAGVPLASPLYYFSTGDYLAYLSEGFQEFRMGTQDDGWFHLPPGTILFWAPGYLPHIQCLQCGDYEIRLEPSPYVYVPPKSSGCQAARGAVPLSPTGFAAAGLVLAWVARHRRASAARRRRT